MLYRFIFTILIYIFGVTFLNAQPDIEVSPDSLHADLFTGDTETQTLTISNEGESDLEWSGAIDVNNLYSQAAENRIEQRAWDFINQDDAPDNLNLNSNQQYIPQHLELLSPYSANYSNREVIEDIVGGNNVGPISGGAIKGNLFLVDEEKYLVEHRFYITTGSGGIDFVVYKGDSESGNYNLISHTSSTLDGYEGWYTSGSIEIALEVGKYYYIAAVSVTTSS